MDSILTSVKKMLGIDESCKDFDPELIMHINSVFMILNQIGVGPPEGFAIEDDLDDWSDFLPEVSIRRIEAVKTYIYQKVRLIFDPPQSSAAMEALNHSVSELEWRLNIAVDPGPNNGGEVN